MGALGAVSGPPTASDDADEAGPDVTGDGKGERDGELDGEAEGEMGTAASVYVKPLIA